MRGFKPDYYSNRESLYVSGGNMTLIIFTTLPSPTHTGYTWDDAVQSYCEKQASCKDHGTVCVMAMTAVNNGCPIGCTDAGTCRSPLGNVLASGVAETDCDVRGVGSGSVNSWTVAEGDPCLGTATCQLGQGGEESDCDTAAGCVYDDGMEVDLLEVDDGRSDTVRVDSGAQTKAECEEEYVATGNTWFNR